MGAEATTDLVIRRLAAQFRVVTLGGVAVIATGLSRNTFDADIWIEPFSSAEDWARRLAPFIYGATAVEPVAIGSWASIPQHDLAGVIGRDGVIRINGLERPLDIFREPNQLEIDSFGEVWERARPMDDGTRLPDAIDLLVSKQETGRDKDRADIIFLEGKIEADYLERLPCADAAEASRMFARFLTPRVAQCALDHPDQSVREMGRGFLQELSADGDPYAAEILRVRFPGV
jgi:hypothetical protein